MRIYEICRVGTRRAIRDDVKVHVNRDAAVSRQCGATAISTAAGFAAAGNDGNTRKSYPASYSSVMSVAAVDEANVVASFSQQNDQVEIAGPGVGVKSSVP